jgi:hypothetical protein
MVKLGLAEAWGNGYQCCEVLDSYSCSFLWKFLRPFFLVVTSKLRSTDSQNSTSLLLSTVMNFGSDFPSVPYDHLYGFLMSSY